MQIKAGVDIRGMQPQVVLAMVTADRIYEEAGRELVVTSVCDGKHGEGSLHYSGSAFDLRTTAAGIPAEAVQRIAAKLRAALGAQFDVVVESDHIHVEFDPKEAQV